MATITGNGFGNTLDANDGVTNGSDMIYGNGGADTLFGWGGDDWLWGGNGRDYLDGSSGIDTAIYLDSDVGVIVNLEFGAYFQFQHGGTADGDRLFNIENLTGSYHGDELTGDSYNNVIYGADGNDFLDGGHGDDTLIGGTGADELIGGMETDTASYAGALSGVAASLATGGTLGDADGDTFDDIENLTGTHFADTLIGNHGANVLDGGNSRDELQGGHGADTLIGGNGTDTASYIDSDDDVTVNLMSGLGLGGTAQGDTLREIENVTGSGHEDDLTGDDNVNHLRGVGGDDTLKGGGGADTLDGGGGGDTVRYGDSSSGVTINLLAGTASGGTAQDDTLIDVENLTGSSHADVFMGDDEENRLSGALGDDWLKGGGGTDTLDGGGGDDTVSYGDSGFGVTVDLLAGTGAGGTAAGDTLIDVENLSGSAHADTLGGDAASNVLSGILGDDTLVGRGGADTLDGGEGNDTASYNGSPDGVTVNLGTGTASGGHAQGDTLIDIENLSGSHYADMLIGDADANTLHGYNGDDTLRGGGGADTLIGGSGIDTASYANSSAAVTVDLAAGTGSGGAAEGDTLSGIENLIGSGRADTLLGDVQANALFGERGADTLLGNGGADTLVGGIGADTMTGGNAGDTFLWTTIEDTGTTVDTADTVSDFNFRDGDRIDLSGIDANVYAFGDQAFSFIGTADFTLDAATTDPEDVTPGEIRYYHAGGDTFIELQTGMSADIEGLIRIAGIVTPEASWFLL